MQYGQAKQRQIDRDWKIAFVLIGLFVFFPGTMIAGFAITIMYVSGGWKGFLLYGAIIGIPMLFVYALKMMGYI